MKKALLGLVLVTAAVFGVWTLRGSSSTTTAEVKVVDRLWIDHIPRGERDVIQVFLAFTEQPIGLFQAASQWKGSYELFRYEVHGNELRVYYGQSGEREKIKAKATECSEKGFDYCLQLDGSSRGAKKYYSLEGWEIDGANLDDVRHRIEALLPELVEK